MGFPREPYDMGPDSMNPRPFPGTIGVVQSPNMTIAEQRVERHIPSALEEAASRYAALQRQRYEQDLPTTRQDSDEDPNNIWGENWRIGQADFNHTKQMLSLRFDRKPQTINLYVSFRDINGCFIDNPTNAQVRLIMGSKNGGQEIADLAAGSHTVGGNYIGIIAANQEPAEMAIGIAEIKVYASPGCGPISWTEAVPEIEILVPA